VLYSSLGYEDRGGVVLFVRGKLIFENLSESHFREGISFILESTPNKIAYSYHYQDERKKLLFRYNNAEHHPEVESYPHHKYLPQGKIESSREVTLREVIWEIWQEIYRGNSVRKEDKPFFREGATHFSKCVAPLEAEGIVFSKSIVACVCIH